MKGSRKKRHNRSGKPLYYIENPNKQELRMLRSGPRAQRDASAGGRETAAVTAAEQALQVSGGSVAEPPAAEETLHSAEAAQSSVPADLFLTEMEPREKLYADENSAAAVAGPKVAPRTIDGSKLKSGIIGTPWLQDYAAQSTNIADKAVTSSKIAPEFVPGEHLAEGSVGREQLKNGSSGPEKLADRTAGAEQPADPDRSIAGRRLSEVLITSGLLEDDAVSGEKILSSSIGRHPANGRIERSRPAANEVSGDSIADAEISGIKPGEGIIDSRHSLKKGAENAKPPGSAVIGSGQLAAGSVVSSKLASAAVTAGHLAPGAVVPASISDTAVQGRHLAPGCIGGAHIRPLSIGNGHILPNSLSSIQIQDGSIVSSKLAAGAVQSRHLEQESIQSCHIASGSVTGEHLVPGAIAAEHLSFSPVQSAGNREVLQQFGMTAFMFDGNAESVEVTVTFDEAFGHTGYVLVAMTNQPFYHASLKSRASGEAIVIVDRLGETAHIYGVLSWIALGSPLAKPLEEHLAFD